MPSPRESKFSKKKLPVEEHSSNTGSSVKDKFKKVPPMVLFRSKTL